MRRFRPLFDYDDGTIHADDAGHGFVCGRSGMGKTQWAIAFLEAKLAKPHWSIALVDPEGDISPRLLEYLAHPRCPFPRKVHYLRPASDQSFALPVLFVRDRNPQTCHEKAVRAVRVFAEACGFDDGQFGPRLSKLFYLGALGLALTGRPLCDLPDLYSHGARHLRELIAAQYPYPFLADELGLFDLLSDRVLAEYKDPLVSRLMGPLGNAQLRRVFGPQDPPLDLAAIRAARESIFLDLSGLEAADARLVGNAFTSLFYHEAMQTPPNAAPHVCLLIDEAFDYLAPLSRGFDRLRKRHVQVVVLLQRLALLTKATNDDATAMLSSALTNTNFKLCMGGLLPDDADLMVRCLVTGRVDLEAYKQNSLRPVAVGSHIEIVKNRSTAHHAANHEATSETESVARGIAHTRMSSVSEAEGESVTDATSDATAFGSMSSEAAGSASSDFDSGSLSQGFDPNSMNFAFAPPTITSAGISTMSGSGLTDTASHSSGSSATEISGSSHARSTSHVTSVTDGVATSESEVRGRVRSLMRGSSRGTSESASPHKHL